MARNTVVGHKWPKVVTKAGNSKLTQNERPATYSWVKKTIAASLHIPISFYFMNCT